MKILLLIQKKNVFLQLEKYGLVALHATLDTHIGNYKITV